jgi:DNA-binding transcriptional regulator GbsR (MarR family)
MSEVLDEVERDITEKYTRLSQLLGIDPTMEKIYMTLFFSTKPLGLKEISEKTGYSVSTVSNSLGIVERMTDVRRFKKPGSKKVYFECLHDFQLIQRKKMAESQKLIKPLIEEFKSAEDKLEGVKDSEAFEVRQNITQLREGVEKMDKALDKLKIIFEIKDRITK